MVKKKTPTSTKTKTAAAAAKSTKTTKPVKAVKSAKTAVVLPKTTQKDPFYRLRMWKLRLSAILVLEAAALVFFSKAVTVPVTTQYPAVNELATSATGEQVIATATRHMFDVPVAWALVVMLLLVAGVYALAATLWRGRLQQAMARGVNEFRWIGVAIGGAAAVVVVALLLGLNQGTTLLMLAGLMIVGSMGMLLADFLYASLGEKRRLPHLACTLGVIALVLPWIVFAKAALGAVWFDGLVPGYLWGVLGTFTAAVVLLGLAAHLRIKRSKRFADAYFTEYVFMGLGFLAASALTWQIFAGILL